MLRTSAEWHLKSRKYELFILTPCETPAWLLCISAICCRCPVTGITASHFVRTRAWLLLSPILLHICNRITASTSLHKGMYVRLFIILTLAVGYDHSINVIAAMLPRVRTKWLAVMTAMEQREHEGFQNYVQFWDKFWKNSNCLSNRTPKTLSKCIIKMMKRASQCSVAVAL